MDTTSAETIKKSIAFDVGGMRNEPGYLDHLERSWAESLMQVCRKYPWNFLQAYVTTMSVTSGSGFTTIPSAYVSAFALWQDNMPIELIGYAEFETLRAYGTTSGDIIHKGTQVGDKLYWHPSAGSAVNLKAILLKDTADADSLQALVPYDFAAAIRWLVVSKFGARNPALASQGLLRATAEIDDLILSEERRKQEVLRAEPDVTVQILGNFYD